MELKIKDFRNWSPLRIYDRGGMPVVDWIYLAEKRFVEPFYDNTIDIVMRNRFSVLFRKQTPVEFLGDMYSGSPGAPPKGFIFHVSRCGSTLVSQMLASSGRNIVLSEAPVVDRVLRMEASDDVRTTLLRWVVNALGQRRFPAEENLFIKFDSWSVLDLPLIERAFPTVPWIFIYREPVEVIVSNLRQPGAQMIPGAIRNIFPGMEIHEILQYPVEERFARTIAAFFRAGIANAGSPNCRLINYSQMPEVLTGEILGHFGVSFSGDETARMRQSSKFDAKSPNREFRPDSGEKKREASETVMKYSQELVDPLYAELETLRPKAPPLLDSTAH